MTAASTWQAAARHRRTQPPAAKVMVIVEDARGSDIVADLPASLDPLHRAFSARRVEHH